MPKKKSKGEEPKYLYRYIPFERLVEILMTKSIPVPRPQNWHDQHDLRNSLKNENSDDNSVIGITCFTEKWETSFHWGLFAKYGVRLTFDKKKFEKRVRAAGATVEKVQYKPYKEYEDLLKSKNSLLFVKRKQYESEQEWRIVYKTSKDKMVSENVVARIPFNWKDLKKITISPYYEITDYHFLKAVVLKMLEEAEVPNVKILRSSLFISSKIKKTELDLEELK